MISKDMNRSILIVIAVFVLAAAGYIGYNLVMDWHGKEMETFERQLREEFMTSGAPAVPKEKLEEAFGEEPDAAAEEKRQLTFQEVDRQVRAFFSYLDSREYIGEHRLENGTYEQFLRTVETLSSNPPVIAGETESLYSLMKNMTHIFRAVGIERINLIKDVLRNESDIIEPVMKYIYLWLTLPAGAEVRTAERPEPEIMYNYSCYFLNTIAGKNYLLRRESRIRILTSYYSVLVLDMADDAGLNSYGIDIRPHINSLLSDIRDQAGLVNKRRYISRLEELQKKHQL